VTAAGQPDAWGPIGQQVAAGQPLTRTLRDGTAVLLRPIRPDDAPRFRAAFAKLSEESRYRRFHSAHPRLSPAELRYLTHVDQTDHVAWGMHDLPREEGLGVARWIRLDDEPTAAEFAVTVADAAQGQGVGTLLIGVLLASAPPRGVELLRGSILASNAPMLRLIEELGGTALGRAGVAHAYELRVPSGPEGLPETPAGRAVRALFDVVD